MRVTCGVDNGAEKDAEAIEEFSSTITTVSQWSPYNKNSQFLYYSSSKDYKASPVNNCNRLEYHHWKKISPVK